MIGRILFIMLLCLPVAHASFHDQMMREGEWMTVNNQQLRLVAVSDQTEMALFRWGGELSDVLHCKEKHVFSDGSVLFVRDVLVDLGPDYVMFSFSPSKESAYTSDPYNLMFKSAIPQFPFQLVRAYNQRRMRELGIR